MPNYEMTDTVFMQILKEFNDLLNRNPRNIGVIESDDNKIGCAVTGKLTPEKLSESIEIAIAEDMDCDVSLSKVESFDYGYKLEVIVNYNMDGQKELTAKYYINFAVLY